MGVDSEMLRDSFALVVARAPNLSARFYDVLFAKYPALQALFPAERRRMQETMLARTLALVVGHLDDPSWLARELRQLGRRHVQYGVSREMYACVGDALLVTLAEAAGDAWSDALSVEWSRAYDAIASLMRDQEVSV